MPLLPCSDEFDRRDGSALASGTYQHKHRHYLCEMDTIDVDSLRPPFLVQRQLN